MSQGMILDEASMAPTSLPDECCAKCKFFVQAQGPTLPACCRRHPPTGVIVRANWNKENTQVVSNMQLTFFPMVQPGQWCGDFKRDLGAVN